MAEIITKTFSYSDSTVDNYGSYTITPNPFNNTFNVSMSITFTIKSGYGTTDVQIMPSVVSNGKSYEVINQTVDIMNVGDTVKFSGNTNVPYLTDGTIPNDCRLIYGNPLFATGGSRYAINQYLNEIMSNASNGHKNINGTWKNGYFWRKINGTWKRCLIWRKINGTWKKGI